MRESPKEQIIKLLRKHPEGLTIQQIANSIGKSRITVTKYIHELLGANIIYQRKVGKAKLCYLRKLFLKVVSETELLEKLKKKL